jgi:type III restriction enzyme
MQPENARKNNVELKLDKSKLGLPEFQKLWANINAKSVYVVDFDQDELIKKAISALNRELRVSKIFFKVEAGR